jgi:hypothetical protein
MMNKIPKICMGLIITLYGCGGNVVNGRVVDESDRPIEGVAIITHWTAGNLYIPYAGVGCAGARLAYSDKDGKYRLSNPNMFSRADGSSPLTIYKKGYMIAKNGVRNITMKPDDGSFNAVVDEPGSPQNYGLGCNSSKELKEAGLCKLHLDIAMERAERAKTENEKMSAIGTFGYVWKTCVGRPTEEQFGSQGRMLNNYCLLYSEIGLELSKMASNQVERAQSDRLIAKGKACDIALKEEHKKANEKFNKDSLEQMKKRLQILPTQ